MSDTPLSKRRVLGCGPLNPDICIVGEGPAEGEIVTGIPFSGKSGRLLNQFLNGAGIKREDCYLTNISKTQIPGNNFKAWYNEDEHLEPILAELRKVEANIYVFMGGNVSKALINQDRILSRRGSIYPFLNSKALLTVHPSYILRTDAYYLCSIITRDFHKARMYSHDQSEPATPQINVLKSAESLEGFLYDNREEEYCAVDIECTTGTTCIPICVGLSFTENVGVSIPLFSKLPWIDEKEWNKHRIINVLESFTTGIPDVDLPRVWFLLDNLFRSRVKIIGQNFKYDESRLESLGFRFENFWMDIALAGYCFQPEFPRNLGFWSSIFTALPFFKDEGDAYNPGRRFFDDYLRYNAKDAVATRQIAPKLQKSLMQLGLWEGYRNFVHKLHYLYKHIEEQGFYVDENKWDDLQVKYLQLEMLCEHDLLNYHCERINFNSSTQVKRLLYETLKIRMPYKNAGTNQFDIAKIIFSRKLSRGLREYLMNIIKLRKIRRILGPNYLTAKIDYDGKLRTSYFVVGTTTHRTSTRCLAPPNRPEQIGWSFQTIPKHDKIGKDIREALVPKKGSIFVQVDSAQAEARVVALLAGDYKLLEMMDNIDLHSWTAAACFGGKPEDYGKDHPGRFIGKMGRHAFNLGIKRITLSRNLIKDSVKFGVDLGEMNPTIAQRILNGIDKSTPKIRRVFQRLVEYHVKKTRILKNPFGFRRVFHGRISDKLLKEANSYIPQSTVTTNTKRAMLQMRKDFPHIPIILEWHDSMLLEVPEKEVDVVALAAKKYMEEPINFNACSIQRGSLTIPADVEVGENFGVMKEIKCG